MVSNSETAGTPNDWGSRGYSVKRHGTRILDCDREPIRTPGCIQAHGLLLVLRLPWLSIVQVSENSHALLGLTPEDLLGRPVARVVGAEGEAWLRQALETEPLERNPLFMLNLAESLHGRSFDVSLHTLEGIGLLELEPASGGLAEPDYYRLIKTSLARLQSAPTLADFCQRLTAEVHALTGLDRVMVYRFHPDHHGEVVAESRREGLPTWLGLHYPAEDIPGPVREIFKRIWVRPLADARAAPAELVPLLDPDSGRAPDLSFCALRAASVMYSEYLCNMGALASLTMPIRSDGELWGLITCHHETQVRFSYRTRAACEFLAQAVSLEIKPLEARAQMRERLRLDRLHGQLIMAAAEESGMLERLIQGRPNLLDGLDAGGVALCHGGHWWSHGQTPDEPRLIALADWLEKRPELASHLRPIYVTDCLARDYPDGAALGATASGLLATALCRKHRLLLLWFRPETTRTIRWAGNPHEIHSIPGPDGPRQTPRVSFELFLESVKGRSAPWQEVEIEAALRLRLWAMELVVDRSHELAELNANLAHSNRELDTFTYLVSYDLKEPLRGISLHARHALAEAEYLGETSRQHLERLTQLAERMDRLVGAQLRFLRICRLDLEMAPTDLNELVEEALVMAGARRAGASVEILLPRVLPTLTCDRLRIREVLCCLIDNAIRYKAHRPPRVEIGYWLPGESGYPSGAEPEDPLYYIRDNGIGIEPAHWQRVFELFRRLHGWEAYGGGAGTGLAIARMLVERHQGRIWVESTPGEGSTFYFSLGRGSREATHG